MLDDPTEPIRHELRATINSNVRVVAAIVGENATRKLIEATHGQVWNTDELVRDFEVLEFAAPLVVVRRRTDAVLGSLFFSHEPRFYWSFIPHEATEQVKPQGTPVKA